MPVGTQQHGTDTTYSDFNSPSLNNSPSTLPTGYAGSYSAADLKTWPSGGILTTETLEDLRKGTNQLAKDFNIAIVSHQSQITTNDGHLDKINVNLNEIKTDSIEIANDLSNKAWDTITIVPAAGLQASDGTDSTSDISGSPTGKNLKSDIRLHLKVATDDSTAESGTGVPAGLGGVVSTDTINSALTESSIPGHIFVNSTNGRMKILNNAVQLGTHTRGSYVKFMGAAGNTGKGGTIKNITFTGQGNSPAGGTGLEAAEVTIDLSDTGVGTTFDGTFLGSTTESSSITTVTVPSFKVDKKGRITEVRNTITGDFATNQNITIAAGTKLSGGGTITSNAGTAQTLTINHENSALSAAEHSVGSTITTSNAGSGNGSFGTHHKQVNILDSIETDAQGHVVAITTRPITYGLDSPKGGVDGTKYNVDQDFDLHVPTEKDFQSLQLQVDNLEGTSVTIPETGPVTINRDVTLNNDLSVADDLVIDTDTLIVDSSTDQVGIGTTSPARKLDVVGTGRFSGTLDVGGDFGVADKIKHFSSTDTNTSIRFPADDTFTIETAGSERFRVGGSGRVGIGTTEPDSILHIEENSATTDKNAGLNIVQAGTGDAIAQFTLKDVQRWVIGIDNDDADSFKIGTNQTLGAGAALTIKTDGNVGIGTTSPGFKLSLKDERTTGTDIDTFNIQYASGGNLSFGLVDASEANPHHRIRTHASESIRFAQAYGDYVIFDGANQRVGIGDMTPSYKLDVDGDIRTQHTLRSDENLIVGTTIQAASGNFDVDASGNISDVSNIVSGGDISATGTISADTFLGVGTSTPDSSDSIDGRTYGPYKFQVEDGDSKFVGDVNVTGNLNVTGISSTGSSADVDFNQVDLTAVGAISMNGILSSSKDTQSTNVDSGALILDGGAGIAKNVFIGGTLNVTGATTLGTLSAGGGGFDVDSSGNITDVGSIAAGGKIIINGVSSTIGQTTATNGALQIINGSANLAFDSNEIFSTNSLNIGVGDGQDIFFLEGNDAHLTIKDGGNVGIGTSSPGAALHIIKNGTGIDLLTLGGNLGSTAGNRDMHIKSPATDDANAPYKFVTGNAFTFRVDTNDALNIDSSGNVGIGTTSPNEELTVSGDMHASGNVSTAAAFMSRGGEDANDVRMVFQASDNSQRFKIATNLDGTPSNDILEFETNSVSNILVLKGNGNVGIGTSDPDEKLEINGKVKISNTDTIFNNGPANAPLRVGSDVSLIGIDSNEIETLNDSLHLRFPHNKVFTVQARVDADTTGTYSNTLMTIKPNGRVGIGTTEPTDKLHVAGTSAFDSHLHVGASTGGIALTLNDGHGDANVAFNHAEGKPSVNGSSGRIEVGVDTTTGYMNLEVGDNSTAGVTKALTPQITINSDRIQNFFQTDIHSNLTIKSNGTHLKFNAADSDTELANILMDNSSGLEISVSSSNPNARRIRMRPGNADTWIFGVNASTTTEQITVTDTTAGSQNGGSIHTDGGISANGDSYFGGGTPALFTDSSAIGVGIGTSNVTSKLTVGSSGGGAQIEIRRTNSNTTGAYGAVNFTANDGHSVSSISCIADGDNNGGELVFKTTTAASELDPYGSGTSERFRINSNGVSQFTGAVRNTTVTHTVSNGADLTLDLRETNIFIINVESSFILRASNESAVPGAAYTIILKNKGNFDIDFGSEFYFTGGDPLLTTGGDSPSPKIDLISGVCDGSNIYCAINYDLQSS